MKGAVSMVLHGGIRLILNIMSVNIKTHGGHMLAKTLMGVLSEKEKADATFRAEGDTHEENIFDIYI